MTKAAVHTVTEHVISFTVTLTWNCHAKLPVWMTVMRHACTDFRCDATLRHFLCIYAVIRFRNSDRKMRCIKTCFVSWRTKAFVVSIRQMENELKKIEIFAFEDFQTTQNFSELGNRGLSWDKYDLLLRLTAPDDAKLSLSYKCSQIRWQLITLS